jgi:hypothetical protein
MCIYTPHKPYKSHAYIADIPEANKTCMYQILTQLVNQKVYTIQKTSSLMLFYEILRFAEIV